MSLLMEALRKAEEAKSKAATEEKDATEETQETSSSETQASTDNTLTGKEDGPVVINPEPDELETLASHSNDESVSFLDSTSSDDAENKTDSQQEKTSDFSAGGLTLEPMQTAVEQPANEEKQEQEAVNEQNSEPPLINDLLDEDEHKDALSLLESSYFSRTNKPGGIGFDDELEEDSSEDLGQLVNNLDEAIQAAASEPESEQETEAFDEQQDLVTETQETITTPDSLGLDRPVEDNPEDYEDADEKAAARETEQEKRRSAGAVFAAKNESRRQRFRKLLPLAALLLIIPVGGIAYWFYSSFNSSPGMQFNVSANGGLANRGPLGGEQTTETTASQSEQARPETALSETQAESSDLQESAIEEITAIDLDQAFASDEASEETLPGNEAIIPAEAIAQIETLPAVQQSADNTPAASDQQLEEQSVSFVRTDIEPVLHPSMIAAYESYQNGDYDLASRLYQQVLMSESNNRDAMLGLASVYLKQNNTSQAQNYYARLLELNPRDPIARAALLEISMRDDPVRQETELKSLISAFPGVAPISFALGNLYASQNRWSEAQSAYFNALLSAKATSTNGNISPDYAFNLAVSLERLNQLRAAIDYYREAEAFSRDTVPGFNINLLNQRINILEQRVP